MGEDKLLQALSSLFDFESPPLCFHPQQPLATLNPNRTVIIKNFSFHINNPGDNKIEWNANYQIPILKQ